MVKNYKFKRTYHRYDCSISFFNIKLQVDALNQREASELAAVSIVNYFKYHLITEKYTNSQLTQLLTNKNVIEAILEITYEKPDEYGVYSSSFEK